MSNTVYTKDGPVWMPDAKVTDPMPEYRYEALRGYASCLAVFLDDRCIGWIPTEALGYPNAREWMRAQEVQQGP